MSIETPKNDKGSDKPDILELIRLARSIRRVFSTLDPDDLDPEERRVIGSAATDLLQTMNSFTRKAPHV